MDVTVQIKKFKDFIESFYKHKLLEHSRKGLNRLTLDYEQLSKYEPELALLLLEDPENTIKSAEIAIEQFDIEKNIFKVRIKNSKKHTLKNIKSLRSLDIDKFVTVKGVIRSRTSVTPRVTSMRFECPNCGNIISVLQLTDKIKEPTHCSCGRKGKFSVLSKTVIDGLSVRLEESPEETESNRLESVHCLVLSDLTEERIEEKIIPGNVIRISGIYKSIMLKTKDGCTSTEMGTFIEVNYIEFLEQEESNLNITKEDIIKIREYANDPDFIKKASKSLFYKIEGHEDIKEVLTIQAFSGLTIYDDKGKLERRGTISVLLCGEPGTCKSFFLKQARNLHRKHYFVLGGKSTSVAGMLYAVTKDPLLGQWSLDAGAFPLAHNGIIMIDEMDKFDQKELDQIHGPLEDQVIYVNKAGIKATMKCEDSVLAASNPKYGRFSNTSTDFLNEMELSTTLVNRFDLIFLVKDEVNYEKDKAIAMKMLRLGKDKSDGYIDNVMFKKYISYAKKIIPNYSEEQEKELSSDLAKIKGMGKGKTYPITQRQYATVFRLAEAKARSRLSENVSYEDVSFALNVVTNNLLQFFETNDISKIDVDVLELGTKTKERDIYNFVLKLIYDYTKESNKPCPHEYLTDECDKKGIDNLMLEKTIEKLKKMMGIYEPRSGMYSILK